MCAPPACARRAGRRGNLAAKACNVGRTRAATIRTRARTRSHLARVSPTAWLARRILTPVARSAHGARVPRAGSPACPAAPAAFARARRATRAATARSEEPREHDATCVASGLAGAVDAELIGRASLAATAAVSGVGENVDALAVAVVRPRPADALAPLTDGSRPACMAARSAVRGVGRRVGAQTVAERLSGKTRARSPRTDLIASAGVSAGAAVARIVERIDAAPAARHEAGLAYARRALAAFADGADDAAAAAILRIAARVDARAVAQGLARRARVGAVPAGADLAGLASVAAGAAVRGIARELGARGAAERLGRRAPAGAREAGLPGAAGPAARTAVVRIVQRVGAPVAAGDEVAGAGARAVQARLPCATSLPAGSAVERIGREAGAHVAARRLAGGTHTLRALAHLRGPARMAARAAVLGVRRQIDAALPAGRERRARARRDARAVLTEALRSAADLGARAAVVRIARLVHARAVAEDGPGRAGALPCLADLPGGTRRVARAAVRCIVLGVDARRAAKGERDGARCGARAVRAREPRVTDVPTRTAVCRVGGQVEAGRPARRLSGGALGRGRGSAIACDRTDLAWGALRRGRALGGATPAARSEKHRQSQRGTQEAGPTLHTCYCPRPTHTFTRHEAAAWAWGP